MNASIIHLGCPKNQTLSEQLSGLVSRMGMNLSLPEDAELIIVNTCGFINPAKEESVDRILEAASLKQSGKARMLVVTGCMSEYFGPELMKEIPEIDAVVKPDEIDKIPTMLDCPVPDHVTRLLSTTSYAYLKIAEGCSHSCSFCLIPALTGPFRSRERNDILREAHYLRSEGVSELVLVAQDTTRWGKDLPGKQELTDLVEQLLDETDFPWIRVMYAYPETLDISLLDHMNKTDRLVPYLDMPLQHVSERILSSMKRGGNSEHFLSLLNRIRSSVPGIYLRTTFIVGFPGESESDFRELLEFAETVKFNHVGVFVYDDDDDLPSHYLPGQVGNTVARERMERLYRMQEEISLMHHENLKGSIIDVIVDQVADDAILGRHRGMAPEIDGDVRMPADESMVPGDILNVRVKEVSAFRIEGEYL